MIVGDANMSEVATYLKMGMTSLVLAMLEADWLTEDLMPLNPVTELHSVSHDPSLSHRITLRSGRTLTAIQLQREYADQAAKYITRSYGADADAETLDILQRWQSTLDTLKHDPGELVDQLDWVAKLQLLEGYRRRDALEWTDARLQLVDVQYSDVREERGLAHRLEARGKLQRLTTDDQVASAEVNPPENTRAYFRGECIRRFPNSVAAASHRVVFDLPSGSRWCGSRHLTRSGVRRSMSVRCWRNPVQPRTSFARSRRIQRLGS